MILKGYGMSMRTRDEKSKLYQFMIKDNDFLELCNYYGYFTQEKQKIKEFLDYAYGLGIVVRLDNYYLDLSWIKLQNKYDTAIIDGDCLWMDFKTWLHEESLEEINNGKTIFN